jgi:hypothetical protein
VPVNLGDLYVLACVTVGAWVIGTRVGRALARLVRR